MQYLFWGILNIGLLMVICVNGSKYFKKKFGPIAGLLFVLGLLGFVGSSGHDNEPNEPGSNNIKTWQFISPDSAQGHSTTLITIDLEQTPVSNFELALVYLRDAQEFNIPVRASTYKSGFESGTNWKPVSIIVHRTDNNYKFEYQVHGTVKWSLLGITLYSQAKYWEGEIKIQPEFKRSAKS